jgi:hypothetical protein
MIIVQTIAMRWMLRRARWADFKLIVLPMDACGPFFNGLRKRHRRCWQQDL